MNIEIDIEQPAPRKNTMARPYTLTQEGLLFRAVLAQSVKDIYAGEPKQRRDVITWLGTNDFDIVCDFANVETGSMRDQMAALVTLPIPLARKYGKMLCNKIMEGVHHDTVS